MPRPSVATVSTQRHLRLCQSLEQRGRRPAKVGLVEDHDRRAPSASRNSPRIASSNWPHWPGVDDEQAQVGAVEDLPGLLHAQFAQGPDVVDARRVDEQHRAERQQFHRLFHRVGGRAGHVGDDRDLLPRQRVQQRRLARVAAAEQADVQAEDLWGRVAWPLLTAR